MSGLPGGDVAGNMKTNKNKLSRKQRNTTVRTKVNEWQPERNKIIFQAAAEVFGTVSTQMFHLLVGLVSCYPVCGPFPAFVIRGFMPLSRYVNE